MRIIWTCFLLLVLAACSGTSKPLNTNNPPKNDEGNAFISLSTDTYGFFEGQGSYTISEHKTSLVITASLKNERYETNTSFGFSLPLASEKEFADVASFAFIDQGIRVYSSGVYFPEYKFEERDNQTFITYSSTIKDVTYDVAIRIPTTSLIE